MSLDPKGFAAGAPNLYGYVANSPANAIDPSGEEEQGANQDPYQPIIDAGLARLQAYQAQMGQQQKDALEKLQQWNNMGRILFSPRVTPSIAQSDSNNVKINQSKVQMLRADPNYMALVLLHEGVRLLQGTTPSSVSNEVEAFTQQILLYQKMQMNNYENEELSWQEEMFASQTLEGYVRHLYGFVED
jgi:hypothetical protein